MRRILKMFLLAILCFVILLSSYQIFSILNENKQSENAYSELKDQAQEQISNENTTENSEQEQEDSGRISSVDIETLQESYPELKAWIVAEGIGVDYPVMQSKDNDFYLTHLYDGSENANGALFLDFRNSGVLTDDNTVIYGHNMDNGAMFGCLTKYKSQDFYEAHPTMCITTEDGDYEIQLISGTVEDGDYEFVKFDFRDVDEMKSYVEELCSRSTFKSQVELTPDSKLVSLCTCTYEDKNARYMLVGVLE